MLFLITKSQMVPTKYSGRHFCFRLKKYFTLSRLFQLHHNLSFRSSTFDIFQSFIGFFKRKYFI